MGIIAEKMTEKNDITEMNLQEKISAESTKNNDTPVRKVTIEFFNDDFALVSLHAANEIQLKEILEFVKNKKFITAKIYYR